MIRINLLAPGTNPPPQAWRRWLVVPPEQRAALIGLALIVLTAAGSGLWWWSIQRDRARVDAEIAAAEVTINQLQEAARLVELALTRQRDLKERLAIIDRLRATQRAPVLLLDTISRALAEGLWLTELRQTGQMVNLEGRALSLSSLTDFIDRLQVSGRFARPIDIVTTGMETTADAVVVRFAIRGEVSGPMTLADIGSPAPTKAPPVTPAPTIPGPPAGGGGS